MIIKSSRTSAESASRRKIGFLEFVLAFVAGLVGIGILLHTIMSSRITDMKEHNTSAIDGAKEMFRLAEDRVKANAEAHAQALKTELGQLTNGMQESLDKLTESVNGLSDRIAANTKVVKPLTGIADDVDEISGDVSDLEYSFHSYSLRKDVEDLLGDVHEVGIRAALSAPAVPNYLARLGHLPKRADHDGTDEWSDPRVTAAAGVGDHPPVPSFSTPSAARKTVKRAALSAEQEAEIAKYLRAYIPWAGQTMKDLSELGVRCNDALRRAEKKRDDLPDSKRSSRRAFDDHVEECEKIVENVRLRIGTLEKRVNDAKSWLGPSLLDS